MKQITDDFFAAYTSAFEHKTVYSDKIPKEMLASKVDENGGVEWKYLNGTLQESDYKKVEDQFGVKYPMSFIEWHKSLYFLDCDCSLVRLPSSNPLQPLNEIRSSLDWIIAKSLITQQLYPFAEDGNDSGPFVFDGRTAKASNEFPIRVYEHEYDGNLEGLSEIVFSSFSKLLECITHYMVELKTRKNFEIIPDFFQIDPTGAGTTGVEYWQNWADMQHQNFEEFGY